MTDTTITLPRSVVEQALKALERADRIAGHKNNWAETVALRTALQQPQVEQEPFAVLVRKHSWHHDAWEVGPIGNLGYGKSWADERINVYTHPQPPRQPLTDEQLEQIRWGCPWLRLSTSDEIVTCTKRQLDNFARAIERAHGIGGEA